jgi:hypothetical protein
MPRCCVCGRFTTHYAVTRTAVVGMPWEGVDEDWYCIEHDPRSVAMAAAPDPSHPESEENEPGRYGY